MFCIAHGGSQAGAGRNLLLNLVGGHGIHRISCGAAHRVQGLHQRNAGRKHGRERAGPAGNAGFFNQRPENGHAQHQTIHEHLDLFIALPGLHEEIEAAAQHTKINHHHFTNISLMAMTNSVGAGKSAPNDVNTSLKAGITKIMITVTTTKATITTEIGYMSADLILDLMASVFSM